MPSMSFAPAPVAEVAPMPAHSIPSPMTVEMPITVKAEKPVYNITKMPEVTCDGCQ
jgi:hypothetical protein